LCTFACLVHIQMLYLILKCAQDMQDLCTRRKTCKTSHIHMCTRRHVLRTFAHICLAFECAQMCTRHARRTFKCKTCKTLHLNVRETFECAQDMQDLTHLCRKSYGVATMSRMLKNICLFAEYRSLLQSSFAKETYIFKHPTHRSHPICTFEWAQDMT